MIGNHKSREEACNIKSVDTTDSSKYHTITHSAYEQILQLNVPHWVQWWINRGKQQQLKLSKLPNIKKGKQYWEVRESLFEKKILLEKNKSKFWKAFVLYSQYLKELREDMTTYLYEKKSFLTTRIIEIKRKWVRNGTILKKLKNLRAKKTQKWTFKNRYRSKFLKYTLPWNIKHEKSGKKAAFKKNFKSFLLYFWNGFIFTLICTFNIV